MFGSGCWEQALLVNVDIEPKSLGLCSCRDHFNLRKNNPK